MRINFAKYPVLKDALVILKTLEEAGHVAYFVGGAVRDVLLGRSIHDVDIATSAKPEETLALFNRAFATGLQHGTVTVVHREVNYEVTTFRIEDRYENYRRPEQVTFVKELKLDLSRRDFTMNAMAIAANGQLVDYFDGQGALAKSMLIAVGNPTTRFEEDALRMLRAIRFATTYKLTCDDAVWQALEKSKSLLSYISMERVQQELFKIANTNYRIADFKLLYESHLLVFSKRKLYLHQALETCLSKETDICSVSFAKAIWMWAALYHYANLSDDEVQSDLTALVFPKKMASAIKLHRQWLIFFDEAIAALSNEQEQMVFIEQMSTQFPLYKKLVTYMNRQATLIEQVELLIKFYWLEQLQSHSEAYSNALLPLVEACGYTQLKPLLIQIEADQKVKKLSGLSCSAIDFQSMMGYESRHYTKEFLLFAYLAVNVNHIDNTTDDIKQWWNFLKEQEVINW